MDPTIRDDIRSRLCRYGMAVREAREHPRERSSFGRYRAGAPYFERYALRAAFDATAASGTVVPEELREEYDRVTRDLASPGCGGSRAYRDELWHDLVAYTEVYRSAICCRELGMGDICTQAGPELRAEIGILLTELEGEYPLADLSIEISHLDAMLAAIRGAEPARAPGNLTVPGVPDPVSDLRIPQKKKGQAGVR